MPTPDAAPAAARRSGEAAGADVRAPRRGYLDWLRGLAVLIMIEAHVLDAWTRLDQRQSVLYGWAMIAGGFGAPLFLFLAGLSVSLSAGSKLRKTADPRAASRAVVRRGLEIFGLAFLFRLQAWAISWGAARSLLKVDILNIMGPSIMAAAWLWGGFRSARARAAGFVVAALAIALLTPPVRATWIFAFLPDFIEGYIRPRPGFTTFAFFPWAGFVFAGAFAGVLLDTARNRVTETALNTRLLLGGVLLAAGAYAASFLPSPFARSEFWTSSPSFFLLRTGVLICSVGVAFRIRLFVQETRLHAWPAFSPLEQLGRTSLFIYWIHVEMIYGLMAKPLHKSLSFGKALTALVVFALWMLVCSLLKERVVAWWHARAHPAAGNLQSAN
ncbi:MAG: heparan-alpha-glucosaminide N-acetyltransferase domain-containing protein [Vicinamibacterales bacterium]